MQYLTDFSRSSQISLCRFELGADVAARRCTSVLDTGLIATANSKYTVCNHNCTLLPNYTAYKSTCTHKLVDQHWPSVGSRAPSAGPALAFSGLTGSHSTNGCTAAAAAGSDAVDSAIKRSCMDDTGSF